MLKLKIFLYRWNIFELIFIGMLLASILLLWWLPKYPCLFYLSLAIDYFDLFFLSLIIDFEPREKPVEKKKAAKHQFWKAVEYLINLPQSQPDCVRKRK